MALDRERFSELTNALQTALLLAVRLERRALAKVREALKLTTDQVLRPGAVS